MAKCASGTFWGTLWSAERSSARESGVIKGERLGRGQKRPVDVFERRIAELSEAGAVGSLRGCLPA